MTDLSLARVIVDDIVLVVYSWVLSTQTNVFKQGHTGK